MGEDPGGGGGGRGRLAWLGCAAVLRRHTAFLLALSVTCACAIGFCNSWQVRRVAGTFPALCHVLCMTLSPSPHPCLTFLSALYFSYDSSRGLSRLSETWVSQAAAQQRRGRAGRVRPGTYVLWRREWGGAQQQTAGACRTAMLCHALLCCRTNPPAHKAPTR